MEDRACDWVEGARLYYECTGNTAPIAEIWPAIVAQMQYFLDRRSSRGLVIGREWVIWGNPMGYQTCEGAGLNAFVYKALVDAAFLGTIIGKDVDAGRFASGAKALAAAYNQVLWDENEGTYYSAYWTDPKEMPADVKNRKLKLVVTNNLVAPTIFPAVFALDQCIVPAARMARVTKYVLAQRDPNARIMFYYFYFKRLYAQNDPSLDQQVLDTMRKGWKEMVEWPWQTTWEEFHGGSKAHCYGMFPGYFLSAYVLGVRPDALGGKRLLIAPRLGDLEHAQGAVVTEFGPVPVSWKATPGHLDFEFQVPEGVSATLSLPPHNGKAVLVLDGHPMGSSSPASDSLDAAAKAGHHRGTLNFPQQGS